MTTCNNNWFIEKLQAYAALEARVLQIVEASSSGGGLLLLLRGVAGAALAGGHPPRRQRNEDGDSAGGRDEQPDGDANAMTLRVPSSECARKRAGDGLL